MARRSGRDAEFEVGMAAAATMAAMVAEVVDTMAVAWVVVVAVVAGSRLLPLTPIDNNNLTIKREQAGDRRWAWPDHTDSRTVAATGWLWRTLLGAPQYP